MKNDKLFIMIFITIVVGIISIGIGQVAGKGIPGNVKEYIGQSYEDLPRELKDKGVVAKLGDEDQVIELSINREGYAVDSIKIGDPIDKVYEVYPEEWIYSREHTIQIIYGKDNHYGVATDYIIYTISKNNQVQSILIGKTADFVDKELPRSNEIARELIQGEWVSKLNHKLVFDTYTLKDNYLDPLWEKQSYIVFSPNTIIIRREKGSQVEQVTLHFWLLEKELYVFAVNQQGKPIKESIEVFYKT